MPNVTFVNNDYDIVSIRIHGGFTKSFTLGQNESEVVQHGRPYVYAWWPKSTDIDQDDVDTYGEEVTEDMDIAFGNPEGRVPG